MRVEIERDFPTMRWNVYVLRDGTPSWQWFPDLQSVGNQTWIEIEQGAKLEPSLVIEHEVWEPLAAAILGLPTDQAPLADHLNDARAVRDRLLALVEAGYMSAVPPGRFFNSDD